MALQQNTKSPRENVEKNWSTQKYKKNSEDNFPLKKQFMSKTPWIVICGEDLKLSDAALVMTWK